MSAKDIVNAYVDAFSESGERSIPMATTDADEVIRSQLVENTGRHMLDSGSHYGRHFEDNQESPPWEKPRYTVNDSWVTENVYHFMRQNYSRDPAAVALEIGLFAYGYHGPGDGDAWLTCMGDYTDLLGRPEGTDVLTDAGLPRYLAEQAIYAVEEPVDHAFGGNTYNSEWGTLSQDLQLTAFGGPYADYAAVQVHGGCDIRGGYTAPRVYRAEYGGWFPMEREYHCESCDWFEAESVIGYDHPELVWVPSPVDWPDLVEELDERGYDYHEEAVEYALERAWDDDSTDGAVFHLCGDGEVHPAYF